MKATELRYERHTRRTLLEQPTVESSGTLRVITAADVLVLDEGASARVFEFDRRRVTWIDRDKRACSSSSLYGHVHDRVSGLYSALHAQSVLRAGGVALGEPWQAAAGYGLSVPEAGPPKLDREAGEGEVLLRLGGLEVARYRLADASVPARECRRWLAHATRMHPLVGAAIVDEGRVPAWLHHQTHFALDRVDETLTLESVAEVDLELDTLTVGHEVAPASDAVHALALRRFDSLPEFSHLDAARRLFAETRDVEAVLAVLAHTLVSVDSSGCSELLRDLAGRARWWSAARRLLDAVGTAGVPDPAVKRKRIATFAKLRPKAGDYAHVLDVFTGEAHYDLGEIEAAHASLGAALERDPQLSGAWVSMGRVFVRELNFAATWDCWDQALAQCPNHPIMTDIHTWRTLLPEQHPQFF
jgi:hypothetical protein